MLEKLFNDFAAYCEAQALRIEGVAVADENRVICERHFMPDLARNIYSHTKSFMATAAGIAIGEGRLRLDDRLAEFFPEAVPENADARLVKITLRHLLTMSSGMNHALLMNADRRAGVGFPDYLRYFMRLPVEAEPGERFVYSSADSIMAGYMIEKAVGCRLGEYLYQKVFEPLEMGWPMWENDPQGHPVGCGGMCLKLTEMMKLGQLYLAEGQWRGRRVVDAEWVRAASAKQIETPGDDIWLRGYGYQFWRSPYPDSYRADGAYGQVTTVLPGAGLVVSVQCPEAGDFQKVKDALHARLLEPLG